ncbi:uncharacterized protein LOC135199404 [Macrobrachium nipponense]|uniref:uncharacterized protein LOC135199404 n=1 Tax=Macrobrachium nipponense TaxID=159736 RepID=UPI0030C8B8C3
MKLTPADRCALLFIQVVACVGCLSGLIMWSNKGYSASALVFVVAGGSISIAVMCGLICNVCRKQESNTEPIIDRPPKYRLTWRKEFLKSIPDDLKADIEGSFGLEKKKKKKKDRNKERPRVIWTSESAKAHQAQERPLEVSGGVESPYFGASSSQQNRVQDPAVIVAAVHGISHSTPSRALYLEHQYPGIGRPPSRSFPSGDLGVYSTQADDGLPSFEEVQRWF